MAETAVALTRTCNKCYVAKPATTEHFYPHKKGKYGLRTECRSCGAKIAAGLKDYRSAKSKEWAANNRERRRETEKKRLSDPVAKEKRRIWLAE